MDPSSGYCFSHDPRTREAHLRSARKGGAASARRVKGLTDQDLPPLTSHEAAEVWTDKIGRAAATGAVSSSAASAALRAVKEWRDAHEAGKVSERLETLTEALADWRKTGDPGAVLKLVDGGHKR